MKIETERLLLKPLELEDIEAFTALWCDPDVTLYSGGARDPEVVRKALNDVLTQQENDFEWTVRLKENNEFIGHCDLVEKEIEGNREIELIYYLVKSAWHRGYATEAARAVIDYSRPKIKAHRLVALIHPENLASEAVAIKLGFTYDRTVQRQSGPRKLYALPLR